MRVGAEGDKREKTAGEEWRKRKIMRCSLSRVGEHSTLKGAERSKKGVKKCKKKKKNWWKIKRQRGGESMWKERSGGFGQGAVDCDATNNRVYKNNF